MHYTPSSIGKQGNSKGEKAAFRLLLSPEAKKIDSLKYAINSGLPGNVFIFRPWRNR